MRPSVAATTAGLTVAVGVFAASWWPSAESEVYLAANRCDDMLGQPGADCRDVVAVSITDVQQTPAGDFVFALEMPSGSTTVAVAGFLSPAPSLTAGSRVDAETWRGRITRLSGASGSHVTLQSPLYFHTELRQLGVFIAIVTVTGVAAVSVIDSASQRQHRRRHVPKQSAA